MTSPSSPGSPNSDGNSPDYDEYDSISSDIDAIYKQSVSGAISGLKIDAN